MREYRGLLLSVALVLATASDTAPTAMLPQRTGSAGSGGKIGFSIKEIFVPGGENIDNRFLLGSLTLRKLYFFFNTLVTDTKVQHKG